MITIEQLSIAQIDDLAKTYAAARKVLGDRVNELETDIAAVQKRRIAGIKAAAATAADAQARLRGAIESSPGLFQKPKTFCLHGITVGYRKGSGKVEWDDNAKVVALIRKHLPEQAEVLIIVEEKPSADALKNLDTRDLARIGARIETTGEMVVIKAADTAVDKLVAKILKEGAKASDEA
ncbi:host-nuclease inhibitor Gam family protein [Opitutus sp. ER46]|uniref:host-nuclease inhibitor Gam family protein n=1 Tax=Opitutus sp. ER46 TaxID=2161864 RepID=UPI000D3083CC|nr:host-nuclease inhibitor Gam family protein [Opitutus sp. ER46]PTX95740.1 hypothetical protein DB354_10035 [Opitutus sp. ER46]